MPLLLTSTYTKLEAGLGSGAVPLTGGAMHTISSSDTNSSGRNAVAGFSGSCGSPKRHSVVPSTNSEPYTVTSVPPSWLPNVGKTLVTIGTDWYRYVWPLSVKSYPLLVTSTETSPAGCGGARQTMAKLFSYLAGTNSVSKRQRSVALCSKCRPQMRTGVSPAVVPFVGDRPSTSATAWYSNMTPASVKSTPLLLTSTDTKPGVCGVDSHSSSWSLIQRAGVGSFAPNLHLRFADDTKLRPVTVTCVPPPSGPLTGVTSVTLTIVM
mmetsp:Transcript_8635/g.30637  ORF Transcript_8635/g.30637 Transcript_8635/m.30637 type:complete len:266 (+) Transcript_8635:158-955(+)